MIYCLLFDVFLLVVIIWWRKWRRLCGFWFTLKDPYFNPSLTQSKQAEETGGWSTGTGETMETGDTGDTGDTVDTVSKSYKYDVEPYKLEIL